LEKLLAILEFVIEYGTEGFGGETGDEINSRR